jgi:tellurite resistance protein
MALVIWGLQSAAVRPRSAACTLATRCWRSIWPRRRCFATVAGLLARQEFGVMFAGLGLVYAILLVAAGRWLLEAGVTPMWGAFTFPLAALGHGAAGDGRRLALAGDRDDPLGLGLVAIPWILWWILKRWPGGKLATVTNAAEA